MRFIHLFLKNEKSQPVGDLGPRRDVKCEVGFVQHNIFINSVFVIVQGSISLHVARPGYTFKWLCILSEGLERRVSQSGEPPEEYSHLLKGTWWWRMVDVIPSQWQAYKQPLLSARHRLLVGRSSRKSSRQSGFRSLITPEAAVGEADWVIKV